MGCVESGEWNVPEDFSVANELLESPQTDTPPGHLSRDTATPMSDSGSVSEASLVNDGLDIVVSAVKQPRQTAAGQQTLGRTSSVPQKQKLGLDPAAVAELEKSSKIRSLLTGGGGVPGKDDLR